MTDTDHTPPITEHTPGPWDCDSITMMYATPDEADELQMIEIRANVTEAGWNTVAFIEAIWPRAHANARLIAASPKLLEACKQVRDVLFDRQDTDEQEDHLLAVVNEAIGEATAGSEPAGTICHLPGRRKIALGWSIADVKQVRPDLTEAQACEVLAQVERKHDASLGVTWDTLEWIADSIFGPAPETDEAEEA
jgi:hypothetical protein